MNSTPSKRGAILVQVSFLLLVLMGFAAVVVDLGIVRATQGFMQAGADTACLEGLRFRDAVPGDQAQSDLERRLLAARGTALVFDEDLDLTTGAAEFRLGAGPQIETGVGGIDDPAGGLLVTDGSYLPRLEFNVENAVHGDLVAGEFLSTDPANLGNPDWHAEGSTYLRTDFSPAIAEDAPQANAFLARLRRTNDTQGLDRQPGISSSGPTVPFLFGLGSGVLSTPDPSVYDPRRDGITVRATAIAVARPAVAVGVSSDLVNGVVRLALDASDLDVNRVLAFEDSSWQIELTVGAPLQVVLTTDGAITGVPEGPSPEATGLAQPASTLIRVGDSALATPAIGSVVLGIPADEIEGIRYVALYQVQAGGAAVITGFGALRIDTAIQSLDASGNATLTLNGEKLASIIAPENASAVPALASNIAALLAPAPLREALLAPVLAR